MLCTICPSAPFAEVTNFSGDWRSSEGVIMAGLSTPGKVHTPVNHYGGTRKRVRTLGAGDEGETNMPG